MVDRQQSALSLKAQGELLSLHRSSLYYSAKPVDERELLIKRQIDEIYTACPCYGVRKITAQLRVNGLVVNHKAVARHMREMGLVAVQPGPKTSHATPEYTVYPYLLRGVAASYPNHSWGVDITYIRLQAGWLYLAAVLDWYSRYVLSWALDQTLELPFVLDAMQAAFASATPT